MSVWLYRRRVERRDGRRASSRGYWAGRLSAMDVVIMRAYCVDPDLCTPNGTGYGYTWRREFSSVREQQFARGPISHECDESSPFIALIQRATRWRKESMVAAPAGTRPRATRLSRARRILPPRAATDYVCLSFQFGVTSVIRRTEPASFIHSRLIAQGASGRRKLICCVLRFRGCRSR